MWWRTLKTAGYSTELGDLRDHVRNGTDGYDYPQFVGDFLDEYPHHAHSNPDLNQDTGDDRENGFQWLDSASLEQRQQYIEFLNDHRARHRFDEDMAFMSPAYNTLDYRRTRKPNWLVHFTDNPTNIEEEGFKYGHPDIDGVHLTTWKHNREKAPGYNFAFPASSQDAEVAARSQKYGQEAVMFFSGGVEFDHAGDQESQVVVWGPNVNREMIFPIRQFSGDWFVEDYRGREIAVGKTYSEAVEFVKTNWQMLKATRDKIRRKEQLKRV